MAASLLEAGPVRIFGRLRLAVAIVIVVIGLAAVPARAQDPQPQPQQTQTTDVTARVTCTSQPGEREHCAADTSRGTVLVASTGSAPCLLGKTWGYDDTGIWVSDGCSAEFVAGQSTNEEKKEKPLEYIPNI